MKNIDKLVRPNILNLCPYSTARDEFKGKLGTFLDANESPYQNGWNRYPDPRQLEVKKRLAGIKGVGIENLFLGNGSDEAIDLVFRIFCEPGKDNVVAIEPSYGMYRVAADINDVAVRSVRLGPDFELPVKDLLDACDERTKAIFLCSPNNPSGNAFSRGDICTILEKFDGIVVLDEAYIDFSDSPGMASEIDSYPNLIILQTCSKAYGMASLRLGIAISQAHIIELMSMVKYPYNINGSTQKLALEMLETDISGQVRTIKEQRARLMSEFGRFSCIKKVYPSQANFILVKFDDADAMYEKLIADKIIVRNRNRVVLCEGCLRITVGLPEENDRLLKSIGEYESEKSVIRR